MATCLYKSFFRTILQPPVAACQSKPYVNCNKNSLPFLAGMTKTPLRKMRRGVGGCGSSHSILMPFMASMRPMVMMRTVLTLRMYLLYFLVIASPSRPNTSISAAPKPTEAVVDLSILNRLRRDIRIVRAENAHAFGVCLHRFEPLNRLALPLAGKAVARDDKVIDVALREGDIGGEDRKFVAVNSVGGVYKAA